MNLADVTFQTHVLPNNILNSTLHFSPLWNHVCIMVPHCVETELLPYIRVHYSQPEFSKYGKVCMGSVLKKKEMHLNGTEEYILLCLEIIKKKSSERFFSKSKLFRNNLNPLLLKKTMARIVHTLILQL